MTLPLQSAAGLMPCLSVVSIACCNCHLPRFVYAAVTSQHRDRLSPRQDASCSAAPCDAEPASSVLRRDSSCATSSSAPICLVQEL
jgi:hypothetical protein